MNSKLYISLLAILAVGPLMATSDTPSSSSSSSSSLTANMSDATESKRAKRKGIHAAIVHDIAEEEEESSTRQKTLRISETPSTLSLPISFSPNPISPSPSPTIVSSPSPSVVIIAPKSKAKFFPAQFYSSPFLKPSFEYLDFTDLSAARRVSKNFTAFKDMASQVLMPSAQQWVALFVQKLDEAKTATQQHQVFVDAIAAIARCPNAIVKLRAVVKNYYKDVPKELRFWNMNAKDKILPIKSKTDLRNELVTITDRIAVLKSQPANGANEELAQLKEQQQKIVETLLPSLHALCPYATAHMILLELGDQPGLPENLPALAKHKTNLEDRVLQILAKKISPRGLVSKLAAQLLPPIHAALATQTDRLSRELRPMLELRLMQAVSQRPFDLSLSPNILITNDQQDIQLYDQKILQLWQATKYIILKDKKISRMELEEALAKMRKDRLSFVLSRVASYLKLIQEKPQLLEKKAVVHHLYQLLTGIFDAVRTSELDECRAIAKIPAIPHWLTFIDLLTPKAKLKIIDRIAFAADRAVILARASLAPDDLRIAARNNAELHSFKEASKHYDKLITEFGFMTTAIDYLEASFTHIASNYLKSETAKSHLDIATEYIISAQQIFRNLTLHQLKHCSANVSNLCKKYSALAKRNPELADLAASVREIEKVIIPETIKKLREPK